MNKFKSFIFVSLTSLLFLSSFGENKSDEWKFTVAPYLFALGLKGDVATVPGASPAEVDVPFDDLLENLDGAIMGQFEARKGKFAIIADTYYSQISTDEGTPGPFYSGLDYEMDLFYMSLGGSYRVIGNDVLNLDLMAGVRFTYLDNELTLEEGIRPEKGLNDTEEWVDPFISVKANVAINDKLYLTSWAGFAVGGDSESTYDLFAGMGYNLGDGYSMVTGYRHMAIDYEKGDFLFDVEVSGPMLGLVIKF